MSCPERALTASMRFTSCTVSLHCAFCTVADRS
jgi:hypothetical protein